MRLRGIVRPMRRRGRCRLTLLIALLGLGLGSAPAAHAAPPVLDGGTPTPTYFSPDGDGKRDSTRYSFGLAGSRSWVTLTVWTDAAGQPGALFRTLLADSLPAGQYRFAWDGKSDAATIVDGGYWLRCAAENADGAASLAPARVVVDRVAPAVAVLQVDNPYTPDLPTADDSATVRLRVGDLGEKDRLTLYFRKRGSPAVVDSSYRNVPLATVPYDAPGEFDARLDLTALTDGLYEVRAKAFDEAENASFADGPDLDVDVEAPEEDLTEPAAQYRAVALTRVRGTVSDRSGLGLLVVRVSSPGGAVADSVCRPAAPCLDDTVAYDVEVPYEIGRRDTVTITVSAEDLPGHALGTTHTVFVDSLPPPAPVIDPASVPQRIGRPVLEDVSGTATGGAATVTLYLDGDSVATASVAGGRFTRDLDLGDLALGPHALTARAVDRAGNVSGPSPPESLLYAENPGVDAPERFTVNDLIQVNLGGPGQQVSVFVYTLHGKLVRTFAAGPSASPYYEFRWDLLDEEGQTVGNGPYVLRVLAELADGTRFEERAAVVVIK